MLAKDLWQTCEEQAPTADCSLKKSAFEKRDAERTALWNALIKKSDLGNKVQSGSSSAIGTAADSRCHQNEKLV